MSVNMTKFSNEVESVHSLLLADNERLTEVRDGLQSRVDKMKELVESKLPLICRNDISCRYSREERGKAQNMDANAKGVEGESKSPPS